MSPRFKHTPVSHRRGIPFFYAKSEAEVKRDVYERYDELVTRQTALHLADELHGGYPFQPLLDYVLKWLPAQPGGHYADVGCSVGRLVAELAQRDPASNVTGIDLSYQMLRQANDYWVKGLPLRPNLMRYGFADPELQTSPLPNVDFALARAEDLPFADAALDGLLHTFLLDRLPHPLAAFPEFRRCLRPRGRMIGVTPLNFLTAAGWRAAHPPVKIIAELQRTGWRILDCTDPLSLSEPMDVRGNAVSWHCLAFVAEKLNPGTT